MSSLSGHGESDVSVESELNVAAAARSEHEQLSQGRPQLNADVSVPQTVDLPCVHCGEITTCRQAALPERVFCCSGCEGAYNLIHGWGLDDFYALRDQMKVTGAVRRAGAGERYEQFDTPEFMGTSTPVDCGDGLQTAEVALHGLHCSACVWLIERAAASQPGLCSARVKMSNHTLRVIFDPAKTRLSSIARFLDRLGYSIAPLTLSEDSHVEAENRRLLVQIAIAGFLAANAMWIAIALYAGESAWIAADHRYFFGLMGTALGVAAVVGPGRTFFVGALASLRTRTPHMDLPVALGLSVGTVVGTLNAIWGVGDVYFDSLATLVFLLLIGRWVQFRQQQRAARAVDLMLRITPQHASLIDPQDGSRVSLVLVDRLSIGDEIRVKSGESIPADGTIVCGATSLDRSLLTGESQPVRAEVGDEVAAGTVNLGVPIDVQVTATGRQSRIGQVMQSVESAAAERTSIVQLADRIGGVFVVVVTVLAFATFVGWATQDLNAATANATALLIVACPCALALATPLAIAVGLGRAAKAGILIRDGQSLQQLATPGIIWFDKTGTLTEGRQRVSSFVGDLTALRLAALVEKSSSHPIARAVVRGAELRGLDLDDSGELLSTEFGGVVGRADGSLVIVGSPKFLAAREVRVAPELSNAIGDLSESGEIPIGVAVDGRAQCIIGLRDPIRSDSAEMLSSFKDAGWEVGMLSGDQSQVVEQVASELHIPRANWIGECSPEEKLAKIRESRNNFRTVVMVGDGANDAAALSAADVGVAVRGGAEVSLQAAPVFIASGQLSSLVALLRGSIGVTRLIRVSFACSLAYNVIAVCFAMLGWISPFIAAILMPVSSVTVIAVITLGRGFRESPDKFSVDTGLLQSRVVGEQM